MTTVKLFDFILYVLIPQRGIKARAVVEITRGGGGGLTNGEVEGEIGLCIQKYEDKLSPSG